MVETRGGKKVNYITTSLLCTILDTCCCPRLWRREGRGGLPLLPVDDDAIGCAPVPPTIDGYRVLV